MTDKERAEFLEKALNTDPMSTSEESKVLISKVKTMVEKRNHMQEHLKKVQDQAIKADRDLFALNVAIQVLTDSLIDIESGKVTSVDISKEG